MTSINSSTVGLVRSKWHPPTLVLVGRWGTTRARSRRVYRLALHLLLERHEAASTPPPNEIRLVVCPVLGAFHHYGKGVDEGDLLNEKGVEMSKGAMRQML
jgi:hypothetical protein